MTYEALHALDLDESFLHAAYNGLTAAVFVTRLDTGHIVYWSKEAETLLGYTPQELVGWTPAILFPNLAACEHMYKTAEQVLQEQSSWRTELQYQRRNHQLLSAEVTVTEFHPAGNNGAFLVSTIRVRRADAPALP